MLHVDEGDLHAWLDGALDQLGEGRAGQVREHLRTCATCREALVAEETLRARADSVLALAVPRSIDAPPFETLVERARAVPPVVAPARPRLSRTAQLGWAASVVLALGAGWMAREVEQRPELAARAPIVPVVEVAQPAVRPEEPQASELAVVGPADAAGASIAVRQDAAAPPAAKREREAAVAPDKASAANGSVSSVQVASAEMRGAPSPQPAAPAPPIETVAFSASPAPVDAVRDARASAPAVTPAAPEQKAAPSAANAASSGGAAAHPTVIVSRRPRAGEVTSASRSSGVGIPSGPDTTEVPGLFARGRVGNAATSKVVVTTDADVEEAVDLIVPDLPVLRVEWTEISPGRPGLRVLQRLAPGDTLEVRFVRSGGAAADALADPLAAVLGVPLPLGWSQVVRVHRDGWLVARAPVKSEELEALVARAGSKGK